MCTAQNVNWQWGGYSGLISRWRQGHFSSPPCPELFSIPPSGSKTWNFYFHAPLLAFIMCLDPKLKSVFSTFNIHIFIYLSILIVHWVAQTTAEWWDWRIVRREGCGKKRLWPNLRCPSSAPDWIPRKTTSLRITSFRVNAWIWDLPNTKHECCPLACDFHY
jgi:hypothetical protein